MFTDPREQRDETTLAPRIKSMSSNPALNQKSKDALPLLEPKVVSRKASLGDEARALFQQNRPKTLSTAAVISSSIVSAEGSLGSLGAPRQPSMDSSALKTTTPSFPTNLPTNLPKSSIETCPSPTTTTTRTTRGRFTIESSSGGSNQDPELHRHNVPNDLIASFNLNL
ncbi:hypothetical protein BGX34_005097 [Mortierella sp. NVP85]|nr:hypothetical protein BGX34_005097 [Mortierella sp. NVP85]